MRRLSTLSKRLLASVLATGMMVSLVPSSAFAEEPASLAEDTAVVESAVPETTPAASDGSQTPAPEPDPTPAGETLPAEPEATAVPEATPTAEPTAEPTAVPEATATPAVTATPAPTAAPEATATPEPTATVAPAQEQAPAANTVLAAPQAATQAENGTSIATYVGQVPAGIAWSDEVTADLFDTPYKTVTAKAADGTQYQVEVVPEGLVYFVDTVAANGSSGSAMTDITSTEPYAAVKNLVGDALLNGTSDQFSPDENTWGLVDNGVGTKGFGATNDKYVTGVYGAGNNGKILYRFTLEPGTYTITSGHHDWWDNQKRSMKATLTVDGKEQAAGDIAALAKNQSSTHSYDFTVQTAQTVTYTLTPTGPNAAAVSWVAVERTGDAPQTPDTPPEKPTLPDGFGEPLEETDGLTYATGAVTAQVSGMGTIFTNNVQWNNANSYHAGISDVSALRAKEFTVLFDV